MLDNRAYDNPFTRWAERYEAASPREKRIMEALTLVEALIALKLLHLAGFRFTERDG